MPMNAKDIIALIKQGIPDADIQLKSIVEDQDHYAAIIISSSFQGKTKIQQHQMVYEALQGKMGAELHALSLKTQVSKGEKDDSHI
ncbi:MAG: BolA family transcriptional regulator [Caedibacter sp. 37-49]|nr:MAG: BolA family transcriptional regulator [Caedibacter sp. 37-49]